MFKHVYMHIPMNSERPERQQKTSYASAKDVTCIWFLIGTYIHILVRTYTYLSIANERDDTKEEAPKKFTSVKYPGSKTCMYVWMYVCMYGGMYACK